jgi:hypothetical protein
MGGQNTLSKIAAKLHVVSVDRARGLSPSLGSSLAAIALAAFLMPLGGCSGGGSEGAGSVDISKAKAAAETNPDIAKAAAARSKGRMGDFQKTKSRQ